MHNQEDNALSVNNVVLRAINTYELKSHVRAASWSTDAGTWVRLEGSLDGSWPPTGCLTAEFQNCSTGIVKSLVVEPHEWDAARSKQKMLFASVVKSIDQGPEEKIRALSDEPALSDHSKFFDPLDIPWRLVQTYRLPFLPSDMYNARQSFLRLNPNIRLEYYGNRRMREFLARHFDAGVTATVDRLQPGAYKSDLFRLCELYVNGGLYADISMVCREPLRDVLKGVDLVVVRDTPSRDLSFLNNAFIVARPGCKFIRAAIDDVVDRVNTGSFFKNSLCITGPGVFGSSLNRYARREQDTAHMLGISQYGDLTVRVLENTGTHVVDTERGVQLIQLKYPSWVKDRVGNPHSNDLWMQKKVYLVPLEQHEQQWPVDASRCLDVIPRKLLQTWESFYMCKSMIQNVRSTIALHTQQGWGYHFADDMQRRRDILLMDDLRLLQAFDLVLAGGVRAHLWAIAMLVCHGGVYADVHIEPQLSFDYCIRPHDSVVISISPETGATGHLWASEARHPLLCAALNEAIAAILDRGDRKTSSSEWFRIAVLNLGGKLSRGVAILPVIDDKIFDVAGGFKDIVAHGHYNGYVRDRVETGGESPTDMVVRGHVLLPIV